MSDLNMKTDFTSKSIMDWKELVEKGLRGNPFDSLVRITEDGIKRGPLKHAGDLPDALTPLARTDLPLTQGRAWHIAAPVRDPDLTHANQQLLEDLKGGASFIRIENHDRINNRADLKRLLEGVFTELVPIQFSPTLENGKLIDIVQSIDGLQTSEISLGLDPVKDKAEIEASLSSIPKAWRTMGINAASTHEAGGTDVQELAIMAASIAEAMRAHDAKTICDHLAVELSANCDTHMTIAKFRAARRLIRRIAEAFESDGTHIPLHAITSWRMMQTQDAWTNLLRVMSAGFGAVIGGADSVMTRTFTDGLGHATPFAHRIARNMQLLMMEESHLGQVSDAAYGSYWHENISEELAQSAWREFQKIEAAGGLSKYRSIGQYDADLSASRDKRAELNAPILGVTLHPAENVKTPEVRS